MEVFDALSAEDTRMLTTVEMLDSLVVVSAEVRLQFRCIFFIFKFNISLETFLEID